MKTDTLTLIPSTEYGIPSGNYDGSTTTFSGDRQKGVGYYKSASSTQTIRFSTNDFVGAITIQCSLDTDPSADNEWFDAYVFPGDSATDGSTAITTDYSITLTGNFAWIRATVSSFTGGTISLVTLTY